MNKFKLLVTKDWGDRASFEFSVDAEYASQAIKRGKNELTGALGQDVFYDCSAITLVGSTEDFMTQIWVNVRSGDVTKFTANRYINDRGDTV